MIQSISSTFEIKVRETIFGMAQKDTLARRSCVMDRCYFFFFFFFLTRINSKMGLYNKRGTGITYISKIRFEIKISMKKKRSYNFHLNRNI